MPPSVAWFRARIAPIIGSAALVAGGCGREVTAPGVITALPRELSVAEQRVITASNAFAFDLLREVRARADEENVFLSPLSASMALGMALNGASGSTFEQMRTALRFGTLSQEEINASYRGLLDLLLGLDPRVEIGIANSAWARKGVPFESSFFDVVRRSFDAEARELDFDLPTAPDTINAWVKEKTRDRIDSIIESIDPLDLLFLINAVYFKGGWTSRFDPDRTRRAPFRREDGSAVEVDMMHAENVRLSLGSSDGVQIAEIPYGGEAFALVVALPPEGTRLADLVAGLDAEGWSRWIESLHPVGDATVALPKFRLSYEDSLDGALRALGMVDAFDPYRADFSRLTPREDACISKVEQKTFLEVDEEGAEAAAVTSVTVIPTSLGPGITVDRPFLVAIRERLSGTILFLGAIGDPR